MNQRKPFSEPASAGHSFQDAGSQSILHDRRQVLALLPLLAVGCAASRLRSPATPAMDKSSALNGSDCHLEPTTFPYDPGKLRADVSKRDCRSA